MWLVTRSKIKTKKGRRGCFKRVFDDPYGELRLVKVRVMVLVCVQSKERTDKTVLLCLA